MKHPRVTRLGLVLALAILTLITVLSASVAQGDFAAEVRVSTEDRPAQEQPQEPAQAMGYDISWWTVDGGGGTLSDSSSGYILGSTSGQPDASVWRGDGYTLVGGFWGGLAVEYRVYLPLVLRNY